MNTPEEELEKLIRTIGPGYHPDTPYDGYQPPILQYNRREWNIIHQRFYSEKTDPRDIYEFGLDIFNQMWAERIKPKVVTYRDGSRSDQVVIEEVEEQVRLWCQGQVHRVLMEVLDWSDAARAAFKEAHSR